MSCSKKRLTKQPYCKDDPKCYWDKRCKTRKNNKSNGNSLATSNTKKLDMILERLGNIELALADMNKTRKNTNTLLTNNIMPSPIDQIDDDDEDNFNNNNNVSMGSFPLNNGNNTASRAPNSLLKMAQGNNNRNPNNTASRAPNSLLRNAEGVNNNNNRTLKKARSNSNMNISPLSNSE